MSSSHSRWKCIVTMLSDPTDEYIAIMQDVHIGKTGRFVVLDERLAVDPMTGGQVSTLRFIEHDLEAMAAESDRAVVANTREPEDSALF